jgi:hypothetical protein
MSTTDPSTPEARRFSTWMLCAALFLTATSLFAPQSEGRPPLNDADVYAFRTAIFGKNLNAATASILLEAQLSEKLASVDRSCGLTSVEIQRLQLAGRGDIKRYFDRVDSLRSKFQEGPDTDDEKDRAWAETLEVEAATLRRTLNTGVFEDGSLFAKILKKTLTADQAAAYDKAPPMPPDFFVVKRWIDPIDRKVWIAIGESDGVKPGTTYHTRKKPRAQRTSGKPDAASGEDAINGTIEVTRVLGEKLSEARILGEKSANPIAKGDAIVPQ